MDTVLSVLITAGLGTWLAYVWQQRSAKQDRYFDASKTEYEQMRAAARNLAGLIGSRIYATHRLCRISQANEFFDEAKENFRQSVIEWNRNHLQVDLDIRTLFTGSSVTDFEYLQVQLAALTNEVSRRLESVSPGDPPAYELMRKIETLRGHFFTFLQGMIKEADHVFRQMHFGVLLQYNRHDISRYSTADLLKTLFQGSEQESAVLRSPTDFGLPVNSRDARLGINK